MKSDLNLPEPTLDALIPLNRLSHSARDELLAHAEVMNYCPGQYVFMQGDRDGNVFYLLEGEIELHSDGNGVGVVRGRSAEANCALAQLQPRQLSALPKTLVQVLRIDRARLEQALQADAPNRGPAGDLTADEIHAEAPVDWMSRMLQAPLFTHLPVANIQRIFARLEPVEIPAGQAVTQQGEAATHYYVIQEGGCVVERTICQSKRCIKLAELGPGQRFGEEALIAGTPRSATVRAVTDTTLMRLAKADFMELLVEPLQRPLTIDEAQARLREGATWLDVRFPEESEARPLAGALSIPLHLLRSRFGSLGQGRKYIACCEDGMQSAVAAFLLADHGHDSAYLDGGLERYPRLVEGGSRQPAGTGPAGEAVAGAPAVEHFPTEFSEDPEVQASLLKAKLAQVRLELHEAVRVKEEAEAARAAAERAAEERLEAERAARSETDRARALYAAAEATRQEVEEAKRRAEVDAERIRREAEEHAKRLQAEIEGRLRAQERELQSATQSQDQELDRLRVLREKAEAELQAERERLAAEARAAELRLEEARRVQEAAQLTARQLEEGAQERLRAEHERIQAEAERAAALVMRAEAMKREVAEARRTAELEAQRQRRVEEERIRGLQAEFESRLREKERQIEEVAARQAQELLEVQRLKEEVATELAKERRGLAVAAMEAKRRLAEARRVEQEVETSRIEAAEQAQTKHNELMVLERKLREEIDERLSAEKNRLDEEFARAAEQLTLAQREKSQAEAARRAVAAEAERKIATYRAEFERMRDDEQAKLEAEKRRLEAEGARIQGVMEEARRMRHEAEVARRAAEEEVRALTMAAAAETSTREHREALDTKLKVLEAALTEADAQASAAANAEHVAESAQQANAAEQERQRAAEARFLSQIEAEVQEWRREQDAFETSPEQVALSARLAQQMAQVNKAAKEAQSAAIEHDRRLLEELGALLP